MKCPKCGNELSPKHKFCVKCGANIENPDEFNIEQIDYGGYHNENEKQDGFKIGSGTFKITDTSPQTTSMFMSSEDLNEAFDDLIDDISDFQHINSNPNTMPLPKQMPNQMPIQNNMQMPSQMPMQNNMQMPSQMPMQNNMQMPNQMPMQNNMQMPNQMPMQNNMPMANQMPMQNNMQMPNQMQNPYMNMYGGYPQAFMQPQFVGYDANGMPIYAPVVMPQFMGYDVNGMPVYAPMPVYQQPQAMPQNNNVNQPPKTEKTLDSTIFKGLFDDENENRESQKTESSDDDFFSQPKSSNDMSDVSAEGFDFSKLERKNKTKKSYMSDTPTVNADELKPNDTSLNSKYMKSTDFVNANDLKQNIAKKSDVKMRKTFEVNADELEAYVRKNSDDLMNNTEVVGENEFKNFKAYEHEHVEAIMDNADRAVEAMPKKKEVYVDELDKIELPEYMKAKKTKEVPLEIPDIDFKK